MQNHSSNRPLQHAVRKGQHQGQLNNHQPIHSVRQNIVREGVVMGERSLLNNRISFNNNAGNMTNNNSQQHHMNHRVLPNTTLNNLNTNFASSNSGSVGANNLSGASLRPASYRPHLNL